MAYKGAQYVVVMQRPVHYTVIIVPFAGCQYALVVMGEFYEIDPIPFAVVSVHFVSSL